ncbi:hypothetical protein [Hyalangium sp.]|nr:hypothetical protein [Hyalangium sp.]HYH97752.1 hypothetical protein [Hyalangium sp.]
MACTLPALLVLLGALSASLALQALGSRWVCKPNPPRRPGSR